MKPALIRFYGAVKRYRARFFVVFLLMLLVTIIDVLMPWLLRIYIARIGASPNGYTALILGILAFSLLLLIRTALNMSKWVSLDKFGKCYIKELTLSLERAMAQASYASIDEFPGGMIRNILYTDVLNTFRVIANFLPSLLMSLIVILSSVILSLFFDARITFVIGLSVLIGVALSYLSRKSIRKTAGMTNLSLKEHDAWCSQFVEMLPFVQSNNYLPYYQKQTDKNIDAFIQTAIREDRVTYFWQGATGGYNTLFGILISALLALPQAGNSITDLVFFTMLSNIVMQNARSLELLIQQITKFQPSFDHMQRLELLPKSFGNADAAPIRGVAFQDVCFAYANGANALANVTCDIIDGDRVLLSGQNGSGKSTFLKLLTGLYLPSEGDILINGKRINEYSREELNREILYINQDERFLNETLKTYLEILSGDSISTETYNRLLRFVNLPDDDRGIEGNGLSLSVGQRKKLCLMKLLTRIEKASLIILDEIAAGMDQETTAAVYAYLDSLMRKKEKIILIVEHDKLKELPFTKVIHFTEGRARQTYVGGAGRAVPSYLSRSL